MPTQMRIYTINRGAMEQWAADWVGKIKPLREALGFKILGAWTIQATNQFVGILSYEGPEGWDSLDQAIHQSEERRMMTSDPARNLARVEHYFFVPVE